MERLDWVIFRTNGKCIIIKAMLLIDSLIKEGWLKTPRIIDAFQKIKRVDFMPARLSFAGQNFGGPEEIKNLAELNEALPIGYGQTISQPLVVAFMLEELSPQAGEKVLDIGSGSGWTSALLGEIVSGRESSPRSGNSSPRSKEAASLSARAELPKGKVIAIELVPELKEFGEKNVGKYNFIEKGIVKFVCADGSKGYKKEAPFDKILCSAAIQDKVPQPWKKQLKVGGRIVTPIGSSIWKLIKKSENEFEEIEYPGFAFVPLVEK